MEMRVSLNLDEEKKFVCLKKYFGLRNDTELVRFLVAKVYRDVQDAELVRSLVAKEHREVFPSP